MSDKKPLKTGTVFLVWGFFWFCLFVMMLVFVSCYSDISVAVWGYSIRRENRTWWYRNCTQCWSCWAPPVLQTNVQRQSQNIFKREKNKGKVSEPGTLLYPLKFSLTTLKRLIFSGQQNLLALEVSQYISVYITNVKQAGCTSRVGLGFWGLFLFCYCIYLAIDIWQHTASAKHPDRTQLLHPLPSCCLQLSP